MRPQTSVCVIKGPCYILIYTHLHPIDHHLGKLGPYDRWLYSVLVVFLIKVGFVSFLHINSDMLVTSTGQQTEQARKAALLHGSCSNS